VKRKSEDSEQCALFAPLDVSTSGSNATGKPKRGKRFFRAREPQSAIKAAIVEQYFLPWARISIKRTGRVLYMDLYAGPGIYDDGSASTPLLVLQQIIDHPELHDKVVTFFGDKDQGTIDKLDANIKGLSGISNLNFPPIVKAGQVTGKLAEHLATLRLVPTLMFLDPFGYKGVSTDIIRAVLKTPGSECVLFFNYNRIMPAIRNSGVRHLVDAIFSAVRVANLGVVLPTLDNAGTERAVMQGLRESMREIGAGYVQAFRFRKGARITHHLVFIATHPLGHKIMKEVMSKHSSGNSQGVASFEFVQAEDTASVTMFHEEPRPIDDLKADLLNTFAGKAVTIKRIFEQHNLGTPYVLKNYKDAAAQLMREGKVPEGTRTEEHKPPLKHPYNVMPDDVSIRFPAI
jgi:three-Cys-motif partner protein